MKKKDFIEIVDQTGFFNAYKIYNEERPEYISHYDEGSYHYEYVDSLLSLHNCYDVNELILIFTYEVAEKAGFLSKSKSTLYSTLITHEKVSFFFQKDQEPENILVFELDNISYVDLDESYTHFTFYLKDGEKPYTVAIEYFAKQQNELSEYDKWALHCIKGIFLGVELYRIREIQKQYREQSDKAYEDENYQRALDLTFAYPEIAEHNQNIWDRSKAYFFLQDFETSYEILENLRIENDYSQDEEEDDHKIFWHSRALISLASLYEVYGSNYKALCYYNQGISNYELRQESGDYSFERSMVLYQKVIEGFDQLTLSEKRFIVISDEMNWRIGEQIMVFHKEYLPNITFLDQIPTVNQIYIAHPYRESFYIPLKDYNYEMLHDKIEDYCYLLQSLGATEITIDYNTNFQEQTSSLKQLRDSARLDVTRETIFEKVALDRPNSCDTRLNQNLKLGKKQTFSPTVYPFIPSDIMRLECENSWQKLATQRLNDNLLNHSEKISFSSSEQLSLDELFNLQLEFKKIMVGENIDVSKTQSFDMKVNSVEGWVVNVDFKSLQEFDTNSVNKADASIELSIQKSQALSISLENEKEFLEECSFIVEGDTLSDKDKRLIERLRIRFDISQMRADELVATLFQTELSDQEKEFVDEIKYLVEEEDLDQKSIKYLMRMGMKLGLTEQRCEELIKSYN